MFSIKKQILNYNDTFIIDSNICSMYEIPILSTGMYVLNISCQFDDPCLVGLYINQKEETIHPTESYILNSIKSNYLHVHQILNLETNSLITIKYLSNGLNKIINSENEIKLWKL